MVERLRVLIFLMKQDSKGVYRHGVRWVCKAVLKRSGALAKCYRRYASILTKKLLKCCNCLPLLS